MCQLSTCPHGLPDRRQFLAGIAAMTGAQALPAMASGHADAILLSCMDFRLIDDLAILLNQMQYHDAYDHVILAGAALGAVHPQFEAWHQVFWDHVGLAVTLHGVREILVIDHRDCGAAKLALGEAAIADPVAEMAAHTAVFTQFTTAAHDRFPELQVRGFLMNLDGTVARMRPEVPSH